MLLAIVAQRRTATNTALAAAAPHGVDARILVPEQASSLLQPGAVALGRLDVADALDGVETASGHWARWPHGALSFSTARARCSRRTTSC